jgi:hypothetical protein
LQARPEVGHAGKEEQTNSSLNARLSDPAELTASSGETADADEPSPLQVNGN